jgi:hypothetical protein
MKYALGISICALRHKLKKNKGPQRRCDPGHVLPLVKNPASLAQLRKLHLKLKNFFQPAGFFTEMLRFDKKFQRNLLATLKKLLPIKKREILK